MSNKIAWHAVLPNIISREIDKTNYAIGAGQLRAIMAQFRQGYVPGNWSNIEQRCHNVARALNRIKPPTANKTQDMVWFKQGIAALQASERQHEAQKTRTQTTFAGAEAARDVAAAPGEPSKFAQEVAQNN